MDKTKKTILIIIVLVVAVLALGFWLSNRKTPAALPHAPGAEQGQQQTQVQPSKDESLPPLPSDNKQAIESEIQGIDKSIQDTDDALNADTQDIELGL